MIAFTVDPGAVSGWAAFDPGYSMSGSIDHEAAARETWWGDKPERGMKTAWTDRLPKEERLKRILGTYVLWLEEALRYWQPSILVIERQKPFRGRAGTNVLEFRGASLGVAGRMDLALRECEPRAWQKHLGARPYNPAKDHQIAAEMMLAWWQTEAA